MVLKHHLDDWVSRIPDGYTRDFCDKIVNLAQTYLEALPEEPNDRIEQRADALLWEKMRAEISARLAAGIGLRKDLTWDSDFRKVSGEMKQVTVKGLLNDVRRLTKPAGMKAQLADALGVPQARVSEWLSEKYIPSGDTVLRILNWVNDPKRKPK